MRVGDVMDRDLTALSEQATLATAIEVLARHRLTGVPVLDEEGKVVGFISEKDIVKAALPGYFEYIQDPSFIPDFGQFQSRLKKIRNEPVSRLMHRDVVSFSEDDSDFFVAMTLIRNNLKRAPVIRDGVLVGVVNRTDLLERIMIASDGR
ncbi:CBS domain-containing protein [Aminithiophilus ramosus]|uniref:CBS domain-containing protein n=2 Tax=Synergistales TaxID=649776 RepID=A0A9Q7EYJ4_9BACT|nr:CBS domain-containing protein [Aminithiophilus ramosus]QTX31302.1 CBS domain-containing protein [Aminithiophilus ramosus]QVL35103.1 CBS domain-containing protein [Synergistota bacterium]